MTSRDQWIKHLQSVCTSQFSLITTWYNIFSTKGTVLAFGNVQYSIIVWIACFFFNSKLKTDFIWAHWVTCTFLTLLQSWQLYTLCNTPVSTHKLVITPAWRLKESKTDSLKNQDMHLHVYYTMLNSLILNCLLVDILHEAKADSEVCTCM